MISAQEKTQNLLLASMHGDEFGRLAPYMELVLMPFGESYNASKDRLQFVYFPTTSIVSLLHERGNGYTVEFASVGNEGMVGMSMLIENDAIPGRGFVRTAGFGYKLSAKLLMDEFNRSGALRHLFFRYNQALITQIAQTKLCAKYHSLDQQLCRWLLFTLDRISSKELILTQELVVDMIGVSTESIMHECDKLQQARILNQRHGRITMLNRSCLEEHACECYALIKQEFDSLRDQVCDWKPIPENTNTWSNATRIGE